MCVKSVIPLRTQLRELQKFQPANPHPALTSSTAQSLIVAKQLQSIIFEDNTGALEIANQDSQYRPRTKHISIKWHHFRDQVRCGNIRVEKIGTKDQLADMLTKALAQKDFERLRRVLCGW